jgi:uncharacterized spore protein YtfJ
MENNLNELLDKISAHVKDMTKTETIIGEEFRIGEYACKPVIRIGVGFGSARGEGDKPKHKGSGTGQGAGAGIGISPVGFLIARGDEIQFLQAEKNKGLGAAFEKVPDLIEKVMEMKDKKEEGKKEAKKSS